MKCPFLTGNNMLSCGAFRAVYIPSIFELNEYCRHERHAMCAFYCAVDADGRFIFPDEFAGHDYMTPYCRMPKGR